MAKAETTLTCTCGAFKAILRDISPRHGTHLRCHCDDCRAAFRVLRPGVEPKGGIHLFQTDPDKIEITLGLEHFECFQLGPNGLFRWYAKCCNTPLFNTLRSAKMPFVGVMTETATDPAVFGPVIADAHMAGKDGKPKHKGMGKMVFRLISRMIGARVSGRWKNTPFFIAPLYVPAFKPHLIDKKEKRQAYKA